MFNIKYNTRFLKSRNFYSMRFQVFRRFQKPIYKIVIVNDSNRIVHTLGYYNPFKINFRETYRGAIKPLFTAKVISLDRHATISWLRLGVIPSLPLCFILTDLGLLKTQMSDSSLLLTDLISFRYDVYKILPFLFDELN